MFVGDLFQLPPVVRSEELEVLRSRSLFGALFFSCDGASSARTNVY